MYFEAGQNHKTLSTAVNKSSSCLVVRGAIRWVDVRVADFLVAVQAQAETDVGDDPVRKLRLDLRRQHVQSIAAELARGDLYIQGNSTTGTVRQKVKSFHHGQGNFREDGYTTIDVERTACSTEVVHAHVYGKASNITSRDSPRDAPSRR